MRRWLLAAFMIFCVMGVSLPAVARDPHIVQVTATEFLPASLTVQKGDVVRWEWQEQAGDHLILSGTPDDENPGELFELAVNATKVHADFTFQQTGTVPYFDQSAPQTMRGTITVVEATPVQLKTWGAIKRLFETGPASSRR